MPLTPHFDRRLRLDVLDGVENFEGEVVTAGSEHANGVADEVVGDDGRDGGGKSRRGSNESFGYAGGDGAQRSATGRAEAVEGVNDSPDRAEQADERRDGGGDGEPGDVALEARDFFRGSDLHAALHSGQAAERGAGCGKLALIFLESAFEDADQRAGTELIGDGGDILQALGLAKGAQEASTLQAGTAEQDPHGKNDGPGDEAEGEQS